MRCTEHCMIAPGRAATRVQARGALAPNPKARDRPVKSDCSARYRCLARDVCQTLNWQLVRRAEDTFAHVGDKVLLCSCDATGAVDTNGVALGNSCVWTMGLVGWGGADGRLAEVVLLNIPLPQTALGFTRTLPAHISSGLVRESDQEPSSTAIAVNGERNRVGSLLNGPVHRIVVLKCLFCVRVKIRYAASSSRPTSPD